MSNLGNRDLKQSGTIECLTLNIITSFLYICLSAKVNQPVSLYKLCTFIERVVPITVLPAYNWIFSSLLFSYILQLSQTTDANSSSGSMKDISISLRAFLLTVN